MTSAFSTAHCKKLHRDFYRRPAHILAPELLGKVFLRKEKAGYSGGMITEVEAYEQHDPASHSFTGISERNKLMFGDAGYLYVYLIYGIHFCANVVSGKKDSGEAVLLRGINPLTGLEYIHKRRNSAKQEKLLTGPGNLCKGLHISRAHNGTDLCGEEIFIAESKSSAKFGYKTTPRIGISKAKDVQWRFVLEGGVQ